MVDESSLSPNGKKVYDAIKKLGAVTEDKMKTADDIMKASGLGKALATAALQDLTNKGFVKRVVRQKSAGYFAIKWSLLNTVRINTRFRAVYSHLQ